MMLNYLKLYVRQALKHRTHSLINVVGLAVALTACLLIARFVSYELSYERGYANAERLYRVEFLVNGSARSGSPAPAAELMEENFPVIGQSARLGIRRSVLAREDVRFYEDRMAFADNEIFELFDWRWIAGDPDQALADPNGIVLTQSLARKYFGTEDPLGQTMLLNNAAPLQVRGVIADLPGNTHIQFDAVASLQHLDAALSFVGGILGNWNTSGSTTYIMLKPNTGIDVIEADLPEIARSSIPQPEGGNSRGLKVRPITSIHLQPTEGEARQNPDAGNRVTVIVFATTAFCILLIAIANFVNLSIARYSSRAREIGLRKTTGASRTELIVQFTGEAVLFTVIAMLLAVALAEQLTPLLTELTGDTITFDYLGQAGMLPWLIAFPLLLGIVAGLYPAIHLSALRPGLAIKGEGATEKSSLSLRNLLVLFQFAASITIIVVALVVHLQLQYVRAMNLGYQPEQVVVLDTPQRWNADYATFWDTFKRQLLESPDIREVTHSMTGFLQTGDFTSNFGTGADAEPVLTPIMIVGYDFFATYGVHFVAGRDFSESQGSDLIYAPDALPPGATINGAYILNELAARQFGWTPDEAVGQVLYDSTAIPGTVIGVVNDTFKSSKDDLRPIVYMNTAVPRFPGAGRISLAVDAADLPRALAHVDSVWAQHFPEEPVSRIFLSDQIDALYRNETRQASLFLNFALLSIVLACMGIFGLASYNAERRTREVGVRKVLGGSVWSIVLLLTNDFSRLVLISNVIAWPVAYFAMSRWLENFAYRIDLTPLVFIGSGLIALCIAWVTVGGTAAKAASAKPVLTLRYE